MDSHLVVQRSIRNLAIQKSTACYPKIITQRAKAKTYLLALYRKNQLKYKAHNYLTLSQVICIVPLMKNPVTGKNEILNDNTMNAKDSTSAAMFEEIKELLAKLLDKKDITQIDNSNKGYTYPEVKEIIQSIKVPDIESIEDALNKLHDTMEHYVKEIKEAITKNIQANNIVHHKHTIDLKSTKTVVFMFILSCLLCLSVFFNVS